MNEIEGWTDDETDSGILRERIDELTATIATLRAQVEGHEKALANAYSLGRADEWSEWETLDDIHDVNRKPNVITNAQFRGLIATGWRIQRRIEGQG